MTAPSLLDELAPEAKWLRKAAEEMAKEGHAGWGNTCTQAAECIERHHATIADMAKRLEAAERKLGRLTAMRNGWERDASEHMNTFGQHLPASVECLVERFDAATQEGEG